MSNRTKQRRAGGLTLLLYQRTLHPELFKILGAEKVVRVDTAPIGKRGMSCAVGAIVGAGLALRLAPTPGRDLRRRLGDTARKVGSGATDVIGKARGTVEGVREDARSAVERGRESFTQSRRPENRSGWQTQAG